MVNHSFYSRNDSKFMFKDTCQYEVKDVEIIPYDNLFYCRWPENYEHPRNQVSTLNHVKVFGIRYFHLEIIKKKIYYIQGLWYLCIIWRWKHWWFFFGPSHRKSCNERYGWNIYSFSTNSLKCQSCLAPWKITQKSKN